MTLPLFYFLLFLPLLVLALIQLMQQLMPFLFHLDLPIVLVSNDIY
ncbi:hypothetical protein [Lactobacillus phage CR28]|nr:hypothetical protein [Lactobacillus phage CR28]